MDRKKLKVVWISEFTNEELQSFLPLRKQINEAQQWIPNLLKGFEEKKEIEIHIISPHNYLKRMTKFTLRNINYYFIPFGIPAIHRHWPQFLRLDVVSNFFIFRKKVKRLINKINPELIMLSGAENVLYSSSILEFKPDFPVLVFIQGFISEFKDIPKKSSILKSRIVTEEKILGNYKYFCGEQDSKNYISTYNPDHVFFKIYFPVNEDLVSKTKDMEKKYDCIYFGRLEKSKGSEDFVRVISEIKRKKPDVKACIIGSGDLGPLQKLASELDCIENIEFVGFVKSQKELFEYVKASKVFLAPPYKERLSSSIREAMLLKVPIVAYATGGIPYINEFDENIYLVKTGDFKEMASKTLLLLVNEQIALKLADKAYEYGIREYSLKINTENLLDTYRKILNKKNDN